MKRTFTAITAAVFASAMALPAFAQVGAGISGNANVGKHTMGGGANADVGNSDAERTEPNSPTGSTSAPARPRHHSRRSTAPATGDSNAAAAQPNDSGNGGMGANAGVGANVGGLGAHVGAGAKAGGNDNSTGGY